MSAGATVRRVKERAEVAEMQVGTFVLKYALLPSLIPTTFVLVYAPGVIMTQETYRSAYDEACAEMRDIDGRFAQLRARKEQMEQIIEALRPMMSGEQTVSVPQKAESPAVETVTFSMQVTPEPVAEPEPVAVAEEVYAEDATSDPFQRRIDNALKHGFATRESRILPRALNGLLSRA